MNIDKNLSLVYIVMFIVTVFFSFGIWYLLLYLIFWVFGPTIAGYTLTLKIAIGTWLIAVVIRNILR